MMKRLFLIGTLIFTLLSSTRAQCPQLYDYLGNLTSTPLFKNCSGLPYLVNLQSNTSWGAYTVNWGDGSPNTIGASYSSSNVIAHTYTNISSPNTYTLTLSIPTSTCTLKAQVLMEQLVTSLTSYSAQVITKCAPKTFTFYNTSFNESPSTTYTWSWGDGSPDQTFNAVTNPSVIVHTFQKATVSNCATFVKLLAQNECNFGPSTNVVGPLQIYDVDQTEITPDAITKCFPSTTFQFKNTTLENCLPQGNTGQRYEKWDLGNHWGTGDSIINWKPWPPTAPISINFNVIGSYTVMLLDSNDCGIKPIIQTVNIVPPPTAGIVSPPGPFCANTAVTFTNTSQTGYTYKWNFGTGGGFANLGAGNKSNIYTTPGTFIVKIIAYVNGGNTSCSDTAQTTVTIIAAPVANFIFSPQTGCDSLPAVNFTNTSVGAITYTWDLGNGNTSFLQTPPVQSYTAAGTYTVKLSTTGVTTCTNTRTGTFVIHNTPVPNFPSQVNCVFALTSFSNQSTIGGLVPISNYTWTFGDGTPSSTLIAPSHTYSVANTYTVKLIAATPYCLDSIKKIISINVKPTANFTFAPIINCPPFAVTFTNTTLNGVNYLWRFTGAPTDTSTSTNPPWTYGNTTQNIQNYTVSLVTVTGASCADSIKKVISVYPKPVASFTENPAVGCPTLTVTFTNTSITYTNAATYQWDFGDGATSFLTDTTHAYTNPGYTPINRTVRMIAVNQYGCSDTTQQIVQVGPKYISFAATPSVGCTPLQVTFASVPGAQLYTWNFGDGSPISNFNGGPTHVYFNTSSSTQTFVVLSKITNGFPCTDSTSGMLIVYPTPTPDFTLTPANGCSPLHVNFTSTSFGNTGGNYWDFDNGQTSILPNPSSTYTNAPGAPSQTFTAKLVVQSQYLCKDSVNKTVALFEHPKAAFDLDTPACSPKIISYFNNSTRSNAWSWNLGDGSVSLLKNPSEYYSNTTLFNKSYFVRLVATSNDGCTDTLVVPLVVHPKPQFFISSAPDSGCSPLHVTFNSIVGVKSYLWDYGDGNASNTGGGTNLFLNNTPVDKIFNVALVASDLYGCKDTAYQDIKVYPTPTALFVAKPTTVFVPEQSTICYNLSSGAVSYLWNFGDGSAPSQDPDPTHKYQQKGEYQITLLATSSRGCVDSFALPDKIIALDQTTVKVPNAFTPNENGPAGSLYDPLALNNDIFHPVITGAEKYEFSIFSRWGELLFDTRDPAQGWDGYYKGKLCTQDVYIWKIGATFIDGKTYNKTGDVLLLR